MGKSPGSIYIYHIHHRLLQRCAAVQYSTLLNAKVLLTQQSLALSLTGLQGLQRTDQGLFNKQKKVLNSPYPEETSAPRNKDLCLHYFDLSIISVLRMCYITVLWFSWFTSPFLSISETNTNRKTPQMSFNYSLINTNRVSKGRTH